MEQFLHRNELDQDERAVLDIYLMGVMHALTGVNQVHQANGKERVYTTHDANDALNPTEIETIVDEFLTRRPDMQTQPLGLAAVMAVLQRFPATP
ncbi:hypothetical protein ACFL12_00040 [Pseudomonadota bacterium]